MSPSILRIRCPTEYFYLTVSPSYVTRLLRLAYLAPDIVTAIIDGRQPPGLTANTLMKNTRLPFRWEAQRKRLGFKHA